MNFLNFFKRIEIKDEKNNDSSPVVQNNNNNSKDNNNDDVDTELNLYLESRKLSSSTQNDLDVLMLKINDKIIKNDVSQAYQLLKQFVYIVYEPLCRPPVDRGTTYNQLSERYHIPSINKLEELYQTARMKSEEIIRINNEQSLVEISMIISILQQIKYLLLNRTRISSENSVVTVLSQLEDDGLTLFTQYLRKQVLESLGPMIQDLIKLNQQLSAKDIKTNCKSLENCCQTLKKLLNQVAHNITHAMELSNDHWKWNDLLLQKYKVQLKQWNSPDLLMPIHNQSAFYIDQIYKILQERIQDKRMINDLSDACFQFETIIQNHQYSPQWLDSIKHLFSLDEMLNYLAISSEISNKYIRFIQDQSEHTKPIPELNNMKGKIEEIMTIYVELEVNYFQLSFSLAIYRDNLRKIVYTLKNPQITTQDLLQLTSLASGTGNNITSPKLTAGHTITSPNSIGQPPGSRINFKISSMLDDIFFVFRKVIQRSIQSLNTSTACSIINQSCSTFELNFLPFIESLLQFTFQGDFDEKRDIFLIILNDLKTTQLYLQKILEQLTEQSIQKFKNENDQKMISICLGGDNFTSISKKIDQLLHTNLEKLLKILSTVINQYLWPIRRISFELKDTDFEIYEINDPFVLDFISNMVQLLEPYKKNLLNQNLDELIHLIANHIAIILEEHIMQSFFNQLGGIHLSKDLRKIIEFLCTLTTEQNVRHKFTKLTQISHILTFDQVNDVMDYWDLKEYNWKLNPLQIKQVLGRRTDFPKNLIHNLKLIETPVNNNNNNNNVQQQQQQSKR
ncbi:hypothetical protein DLAC_05186 [Tieghemostelium lacteum]|uniref:Dilute domain-containing protein n=1 Tax=Tieghemostelium lacteum TaxID=361077 RepID=A0A151ZIJ8_TIELA|nr:hypothetical protein DLAC_05186 [Tieghemostelium lacteum]|eukprot:KYQ93793.1 hypothetical protein DLAC_05186 [Tieghemostelium lacteum]